MDGWIHGATIDPRNMMIGRIGFLYGAKTYRKNPDLPEFFSLVSFECFFELIYFSARPGILGFEGERWQSILQIVIICKGMWG